LRHYVGVQIAAVLQGKQAGKAAAEGSGIAGNNGQTHAGHVEAETFVSFVN